MIKKFLKKLIVFKKQLKRGEHWIKQAKTYFLYLMGMKVVFGVDLSGSLLISIPIIISLWFLGFIDLRKGI